MTDNEKLNRIIGARNLLREVALEERPSSNVEHIVRAAMMACNAAWGLLEVRMDEDKWP